MIRVSIDRKLNFSSRNATPLIISWHCQHQNIRWFYYRIFFISFSSCNTQFNKSGIFCLFTFWVFFQDKSFKLIPKYTRNANITCYIKKEKKHFATLQFLGNWNLGFVKLGVRWAERNVHFCFCFINSRTNQSGIYILK